MHERSAIAPAKFGFLLFVQILVRDEERVNALKEFRDLKSYMKKMPHAASKSSPNLLTGAWGHFG